MSEIADSGAAVERKESLPLEHSGRPLPAVGATLATSGTVGYGCLFVSRKWLI
jgi:hypothetical protein